MLRGVAASGGSYRGRARVIDTIEQAATLREGEVLVCRTTTPAWVTRTSSPQTFSFGSWRNSSTGLPGTMSKGFDTASPGPAP